MNEDCVYAKYKSTYVCSHPSVVALYGGPFEATAAFNKRMSNLSKSFRARSAKALTDANSARSNSQSSALEYPVASFNSIGQGRCYVILKGIRERAHVESLPPLSPGFGMQVSTYQHSFWQNAWPTRNPSPYWHQ